MQVHEMTQKQYMSLINFIMIGTPAPDFEAASSIKGFLEQILYTGMGGSNSQEEKSNVSMLHKNSSLPSLRESKNGRFEDQV